MLRWRFDRYTAFVAVVTSDNSYPIVRVKKCMNCRSCRRLRIAVCQ